MPKVVNPTFPLNGLFGIIKPSGRTSMSLLDSLKPLLRESSLFVPDEKERAAHIEARKKGNVKRRKNKTFRDPVKIGQGGTLDPLADGVLVVGVNKGTKALGRFLDCSKEYYTTAILGCETDSYDSDGAIVRTAPWAHVTKEMLSDALSSFRGDILQLPPVYSALKMDGHPLYEYARSGKPLPRPIEPRHVTVYNLELVDFQEAALPSSSSSADPSTSSDEPPPPTDESLSTKTTEGHRYTWPTKSLDAEQIAAMDGVRKLIAENVKSDTPVPSASIDPVAVPSTDAPSSPTSSVPAPSAVESSDPTTSPSSSKIPPVFTLKMTVSSGTYVRSIIHDLAHAVGSSAHVVALSRTRQGDFGVGEGYVSERGYRVAPSPSSASEVPTTSSSEGAEGSASVKVETSEAEKVGGEGGCIPWSVFESAIQARAADPEGYVVTEGEREEWEERVLECIEAP